MAIAGTGGVHQVFATTSGYVKVGENGTGTTTFVRSVPYSTWLSLSLSEQAAWTAMCGPMAFASLNKTDIEEAGVPSDFQDKVPEALTIGGSGGVQWVKKEAAMGRFGSTDSMRPLLGRAYLKNANKPLRVTFSSFLLLLDPEEVWRIASAGFRLFAVYVYEHCSKALMLCGWVMHNSIVSYLYSHLQNRCSANKY